MKRTHTNSMTLVPGQVGTRSQRTQMGIASLRVGVIFWGLMIVGHASFAIGQEQPQSPTDLVRELSDQLRTCSRDERDDLLVKSDYPSLGPDGKPLIPILLGMLEDKTPPAKQYSFGFSRPSRELTAQEIRDQDAETILTVIASFGREGVEPLGRTLKSDDAATRAYAANGLGKIGAAAEDAMPHLMHALKDDDARVRRNAVWALQQIGRQTQRSIPAITDTLDDDDPEVVAQACESLRQFGSAAQAALPQLVATANRYERLYRAGKLPKGDQRYMASQLSAALLETEPALAVPRLIRVLRSQESYRTYPSDRPVSAESPRNREARGLAAERLASFGQDSATAVPLLVELARGSESAGGFGRPSGHAFNVLVAIGKPARELTRLRVLPLIENDLDSERVWKRLHAAYKILRVFPKHQRALDVVVAALEHEGPLPASGLGGAIDLRADAAAIAARVGQHDRRMMPALRKLLKGPPTPIKLQAARAIGILDPADTRWRAAMVECLKVFYDRRLVSDSSSWDNVGDVTYSTVVEAYKLLGNDAQPFYAHYVGVLGRFTGGDLMRAPTRDPRNMQRVVELGTAIVPTLIEAVEENLPADRWYDYNYLASEALGLIGKDAAPAVPALCKVLKESKDPGIRQHAAIELGRIGANSELTVPALTSALDDGWAKVRAAAAKALLSFGAEAKPALKKLRELEGSEFASVRQPVKATIAAIGDQ